MRRAWPELASSTSNQISFIEVLGTHLFQDLDLLIFLYTSLLTSDPALCSVVIISYNSILHFFKFCMYTCITHKICIDKFPSRKSNCLFLESCICSTIFLHLSIGNWQNKQQVFLWHAKQCKTGFAMLSAFSIRIWDLSPCLFRADIRLIKYWCLSDDDYICWISNFLLL